MTATAPERNGPPATEEGTPTRNWGGRGRSSLELVLAVSWVVIGVAVILMSAQIRVPAIADPIGPRALPVAVGAMMVFLGAVLTWRAVRDVAPAKIDALDDEADDVSAPIEPMRLGLAILVIAAYLLLMPIITFIPATAAAGGVLLWTQGSRGLVVLLLPLGLGIAIYVVFTSLLNVRFP